MASQNRLTQRGGALKSALAIAAHHHPLSHHHFSPIGFFFYPHILRGLFHGDFHLHFTIALDHHHLSPWNGKGCVSLERLLFQAGDDHLNILSNAARPHGLEQHASSVGRMWSGHPAEGKPDHGEGRGDQKGSILVHGGKMSHRIQTGKPFVF